MESRVINPTNTYRTEVQVYIAKEWDDTTMVCEWYTVKTFSGSQSAIKDAKRYAKKLKGIGSKNPTMQELKELNII